MTESERAYAAVKELKKLLREEFEGANNDERIAALCYAIATLRRHAIALARAG